MATNTQKKTLRFGVTIFQLYRWGKKKIDSKEFSFILIVCILETKTKSYIIIQ